VCRERRWALRRSQDRARTPCDIAAVVLEWKPQTVSQWVLFMNSNLRRCGQSATPQGLNAVWELSDNARQRLTPQATARGGLAARCEPSPQPLHDTDGRCRALVTGHVETGGRIVARARAVFARTG
jgi:hypothetical protein